MLEQVIDHESPEMQVQRLHVAGDEDETQLYSQRSLRMRLLLTVGRMAERDTGAARRRKKRRLRSWVRREKLTVEMILAEARHRSSSLPPTLSRNTQRPRAQKTAKT